MSPGTRDRLINTGVVALAVAAPVALTAILVIVGTQGLTYVFLYMGVVAVIAVLRGLWPSLLAAAVSFLLVDWYFVPPLHTFTISSDQDLLILVVFFTTAGVVGALATVRRRALLRAEALTRQLGDANDELLRLNREQAEAAQFELRLARTEQQVRALQESEQAQREIMANVSHDLRTPLSTILTASTDLLQKDELSPAARERLETIAAESRRLNKLVTDTLDLARIESNGLQLDLEPTRLADAVAAATERLRSHAPERTVRWRESDHDVMVLADWTRLGQILDNLLGNADRYSPPATHIEVLANAEEQEGMVVVRVVDAGPGVPEAYRAQLFDRFVRTPRESDLDAGQSSGLGLAIVRGLVEAHAGTIELEDRPGPGASFRFTLPKV
ncbi:MAG TPA: ATP-binding protein [Candidatus Dormibacteraeota bacterium]|jgi:K+-sensing histidine kinase KdpD|nr:ATP-binding protein [Candidatus Dormibacteraeota bacterium]